MVQAGIERRDGEIRRLAQQVEGCDHGSHVTLLQRAETHENIILQLHQQVCTVSGYSSG